MVEISSTAVAEIERIQRNKHRSLDSFLRLRVKSGGCSGLFYDLELENTLETSKDNLDHQLDEKGDYPDPRVDARRSTDAIPTLNDRIIEIQGIKLIVDAQSWQYIEHLKLDYSEDLMGGGFRFYNPRIKNTCGCGISFAAIE